MDIYSFISLYCQCSGTEITNKEAVGFFEYYKQYCVCGGCLHVIPMLTSSGEEPDSFPVNVINVNSEIIGLAADKAHYIAIWNEDPDNRMIGLLSGAVGPFSFTLLARDCENLIDHVIGNPVGTYTRLFEDKFESVFE